MGRERIEYEFLPPALEIEETPVSPVRRALIWLIFTLTVCVVAWACIGRVDIVAVARGKVIPDGRVKVIQPMETGVIRAIHVKEGQRVKEGQLLIELDPTITQADADSTARTLAMHKADRARLMEELNQGGAKSSHGDRTASGNIANMQKQLKQAREEEFRAKEEALGLVVAQRENALRAAEAILAKLERTSAILKEQEGSLATLYNKGFLARTSLLDKRRELFAAEEELGAQKMVVLQERDTLNEARKNMDALRKEREKTILTDMVEKEKAISAMEGEVIKAQKKHELVSLYSPVDGTVHGLATYTVGGVVTPAQPIVTIVPEGTPLVVEAMALNSDVGFLKTGQDVEIKLDTFPFQKYGTIKGKLAAISPDAVEDEKQGPVYRITVTPEAKGLVVDGKAVDMSPGMTASVEVKTGKRRIIEFFLSPVMKYTSESLTLR